MDWPLPTSKLICGRWDDLLVPLLYLVFTPYTDRFTSDSSDRGQSRSVDYAHMMFSSLFLH